MEIEPSETTLNFMKMIQEMKEQLQRNNKTFDFSNSEFKLSIIMMYSNLNKKIQWKGIKLLSKFSFEKSALYLGKTSPSYLNGYLMYKTLSYYRRNRKNDIIELYEEYKSLLFFSKQYQYLSYQEMKQKTLKKKVLYDLLIGDHLNRDINVLVYLKEIGSYVCDIKDDVMYLINKEWFDNLKNKLKNRSNKPIENIYCNSLKTEIICLKWFKYKEAWEESDVLQLKPKTQKAINNNSESSIMLINEITWKKITTLFNVIDKVILHKNIQSNDSIFYKTKTIYINVLILAEDFAIEKKHYLLKPRYIKIDSQKANEDLKQKIKSIFEKHNVPNYKNHHYHLIDQNEKMELAKAIYAYQQRLPFYHLQCFQIDNINKFNMNNTYNKILIVEEENKGVSFIQKILYDPLNSMICYTEEKRSEICVRNIGLIVCVVII